MSPDPRTVVRASAPVLAAALAVLGPIACGDRGQGTGEQAGAPGERPAAARPGSLSVTVHFTGPGGEGTVPVRREVPAPAGGSAPPGPADSLRAAVGALLRGPSAEEAERGLSSFFSGEITGGALRSVEVRDGRAILDFDDLRQALPNASSSAGSRELLDQLGATVLRFGTVREAEYRMEGSCERFWNWLQRPCQIVVEPAGGRPPARGGSDGACAGWMLPLACRRHGGGGGISPDSRARRSPGPARLPAATGANPRLSHGPARPLMLGRRGRDRPAPES